MSLAGLRERMMCPLRQPARQPDFRYPTIASREKAL
jgi:hypothetical protein